MALLFGGATSDVVNCGTGTSIDLSDPLSVLLWAKPVSLSTFRTYFDKTVDASNAFRLHSPGTGADELRFIFSRAGDLEAAYRTNNANLVDSAWNFIAVTLNSGNSAGELVNIYRGSLSALATECTYDVTTDQSGAVGNPSTADFLIGNQDTLSSAFQGSIAWVGAWNRELTLAEIQAQQFHPHVTNGCVLFSHLGWSVADWSGNGNNGTVTGATAADHVPLGPLVLSAPRVPYVVAAAPAGNPWYAYAQQ